MNFASLLSLATTVLSFIVAIGILVAVHEFGHFWVARRLGIRVLRFSIGFGRPLWRRTSRKDGVEYMIASIPLGGYVKLLDEREGNVAPLDAPYAFNRQPVWKRIATLLAGPAFNLVFAVLAYWVLLMIGIPTLKPVVGTVLPNSMASAAGLREKDVIDAVGNRQVGTREDAMLGIFEDVIDGTVRLRVRGSDGSERAVLLEAGKNRRDLTHKEALLPGLGFDFWYPRIPAVIGKLADGGAAQKAGLEVGDEILKFDGEAVTDFVQLTHFVQPRMNRQVTVEIKRNGVIREIQLKVGEDTTDGRSVGRIGVQPAPGAPVPAEMRTLQQYGPLAALGNAAERTWDTSTFTLKILWHIVTGKVSVKNISGPISIAEYTGFAARQGGLVFLNTLALISISLGVLNLLPIPILDGGQVVYQLAELAKGSPVSERAQLLGQQVGIALLILMMSLAFYNDIARHLS